MPFIQVSDVKAESINSFYINFMNFLIIDIVDDKLVLEIFYIFYCEEENNKDELNFNNLLEIVA